MAFQRSDEVLTIKTHSGLIASFSFQLVKPGLIDLEFGKALNKRWRAVLSFFESCSSLKGIQPGKAFRPISLINKMKEASLLCTIPLFGSEKTHIK